MKTVIKCVDGSVAVMTLVDGADLSEALVKWGHVNPGKYLSHRSMPDESIPADREFRGAWTDTSAGLSIDIDMVKARAIHLNRIRTERNAELAALDIEQIKAQDQGRTEDGADLKAKKQILRDIPQTIAPSIESASTIEELKAITYLKAKENAGV